MMHVIVFVIESDSSCVTVKFETELVVTYSLLGSLVELISVSERVN